MDRNSPRLALSYVIVAVLFSASIRFAGAAPAATTTTLAATSAGSTVTTLSSGSVVTLTAAVSSNSAKVTVGQVKFCDASVSLCTDIHLLGTAQLTSAGTAVLRFVPPIGSHTYKAVFAGTKNFVTSTSATATLGVTGLVPSVTLITASGEPGNWSITATVGGAGAATPTGTVSFANASANNTVLGIGALGAGPATLQFIQSEIEYRGGYVAAVVGDFNGDGLLDIAEAFSGGYTMHPFPAKAMVTLGDGTGNFMPAAAMDIGNNLDDVPIAVGDFNGDGILDLAVGSPSAALTILLGKGDGTFSAGQTIAMAGTFTSFVVADFNGDGIADLAVLNPNSDLVILFQGNGDGTFTASAAAPSATGPGPSAIVQGDFNGDGVPDLAITSSLYDGTNGKVTVLLGNGDGSFTATASPATGYYPNGIVAGDFNADGNLDLAVANEDGTVTVLLGNGHGAFSQAPGSPVTVSIAIGVRLQNTLSIGDLNGDGIPDLVSNTEVVNTGGLTIPVLLGSGDGTFAARASPFVYTYPFGFSPICLGDFNGDGLTDIESGVGPLIAVTQAATATINGTAVSPGTGSQLVAASYLGDSNYKASISATTSLQAAQGVATVNVTASANSVLQTTTVVLTATVTGSGLPPTGSVTFFDGSAYLGTATLNSSGVATYSATALPVGSNIITTSYGGDPNYIAANSAPLVLTVTSIGGTASTMTVKPASGSILAGQALAVSISVSGAAGGPTPTGQVTLSSGAYSSQEPLASGTANFTIPVGTLISATNTITASYSGDSVYAAGTATSTVTASQILTAIPNPSPVSAGGSATATATISAATTYSGTLNLTCVLTTSPAGAQSLPTCTLNPASLAFSSGGSGTSVLTVKTTAASTASLRHPAVRSLFGIGDGGAVLALFVAYCVPWRRRLRISMLALVSFFLTAAAIGCGGSGSHIPSQPGQSTAATTAGNYTFTVTGTDASNAAFTSAATVVVTVQ